MASQGKNTSFRPLTIGMKGMLLAASGLVLLVGTQLFIFTERTDRYFAWTIQSYLTAASIGAAYWSAFLVEFLASRQTVWVRARIAVPAVLLFTILTFIITLIHLDRFHLGSEFEFMTQVSTYAWIAVYALVPFIMGGLLIMQERVPGTDSPKQLPLPVWLRAILGVHALIMLPLGMAFMVAPTDTLSLWLWTLTPLTARVVGAWLLGFGFAAVQAAWENDWERVAAVPGTYVLLGSLEFIALARYSDEVNWDKPAAWIYVITLASILLIGLYGVFTVRKLEAG